ncbi:MAG: ABC transporter ATP-binding protein [bacterium JZ-2024 1]
MESEGVFVDLRNAGRRYRSGFALTGATLRILAGSAFGFIGLNGAGKSTLLRLLLGFARLTTGTVEIRGLPPSDPRAREGIGYLSETLLLPRNLTPLEVVETIQRLARRNNGSRSPAEWLEWAGLPPSRWRVPCSALSKGQAQRVGLAQAFATAESALILDEPSTALDPIGRSDFLRMVREWKKPYNTLVLTSHILNDVEVLCDRLCVLHEGRIRFTGGTQDFIREQSASSLQEAFVKFVECQKS